MKRLTWWKKTSFKIRKKKQLKQMKSLQDTVIGIEASMRKMGYSRQQRKAFWTDFVKMNVAGKLKALGIRKGA